MGDGSRATLSQTTVSRTLWNTMDMEKNGVEQDIPGAADMGNLREAV